MTMRTRLRTWVLGTLCLMTTRVQADHWVLGDEASMHCYALKGTPEPATITNPAGFLLRWSEPVPQTLEEGLPVDTNFEAIVVDEDLFWNSLKTTLNKTEMRPVCKQPCPEAAGLVSQKTCCVFHANLHSCRAPATCEPWVKPTNDTEGGTLVTHTSAQWGPWGTFTHTLNLPEGEWTIIAHVKVLDFQCAVGTNRLVLAPSTSTVLIAAVASIGGVLLVLSGLTLFCVMRRKGSSRDNSNAPKDLTRPVALLFTDIQSSTTLWATAPAEMAEALDAHHSEIRKLIAKHKCYEVKTIGDSFMIVSHDPVKLAKLALELQTRFVDIPWGTDVFDKIYSAAEAERQQDGLEKGEVLVKSAGGALGRAVAPKSPPGHNIWNGIRVRCGLHIGMCDIKHDEITRGYDYYGPPVNCAARIESVCHGGQVGMSKEMRDAVFDSLEPLAHWTNLGEVALRGVGHPVTIVEVTPVALGDRKFGPLRLEKDDDDEEREDDNRSVGGDSVGSAHTVGTVYSRNAGPALHRHPLLKMGKATEQELTISYNISHACISTLLASAGEKDKPTVLKIFCDRMKIPYKGTSQQKLGKTVQELALRVLPSTVTQIQQNEDTLGPHDSFLRPRPQSFTVNHPGASSKYQVQELI